MSSLYVVPIKLSKDLLLPPLRERILNTFHIETKIGAFSIDPSSGYDSSRNQYNSSALLAELIATQPKDTLRILGVADLDLFVPVLTFVFGEAQLNGPAAVVSIHRLKNQFYGLPKDERLLQERLEKEAIHELGHTFGLLHCRDDSCVMSASTYVENIDLKSDRFCFSCSKILNGRKGP